MTYTQADVDLMTREDLEKLKFTVDTEWNVAVRIVWVVPTWASLQDGYDSDPLITTDEINTSVKIRVGSWSDGDIVLEIQDGSSQKNFTVKWDWETTVAWLIDNELTASQLIATDSNKKLQSLDTTTYPSIAEIAYVKWVTSEIQTQLDSKIDAVSSVWSSPNSDWATITWTVLNLEPADLTNPWVVTTWAQWFSWRKIFVNTFVDQVSWSWVGNSLTIENTGNVSEFVVANTITLEVADNFDHSTLSSMFFNALQSWNGDIDTLWWALWAVTQEWTWAITTAIWLQWQVTVDNASWSITNWYALRAVIDEADWTFGNAFWLKVEDVATSGNNYAIYTWLWAVRFWWIMTLATYGSWTNSGTLAYSLWVDSSGNVIEYTASSGWDVSKVGTPVDNQIWVWTGDGTIEWDAALTFDTTTDTLTTVNTVLATIKASWSWWIEIKNSAWTDVIIAGAWAWTGVSIAWTTNVSSASDDYHQLSWWTWTITDTATWSSTNINVNIVPKWSGRLQSGGVNVPTISSTDTFTNKTIDVDSNTISNIEVDNLKSSAISSASDINTGTSTIKLNTPDALAWSYAGTKSVSICVFDSLTTPSTWDGKVYFTIPSALNWMKLVRANANAITVWSSWSMTVQIHNLTDTVDMLTWLISVWFLDYAGTPWTIDTSNDVVATDDLLRIDVDSIYSTGSPKWLIVTLDFRLP